MQKVLTLILTFIAISLVVAVIALKFIAPSSHVQKDALVLSEVPADTSTMTIEEPTATPEELTFELTDEEGKSFTAESLKGKISIVNFVFRNCKTVCPFLMSKTRGVTSDLQDYYDQLQVLSITVDPTNDTHAVLQDWKEEVAVKGLAWKFLTGAKEEVLNTVRDDFKQTVMENAADMDMPIAHSSYLVLVNAEGKIAGFYDSNDNYKMKELTEAAAKLAASLKTTSVNH
jgi:protein SCO1